MPESEANTIDLLPDAQALRTELESMDRKPECLRKLIRIVEQRDANGAHAETMNAEGAGNE